MTIRKKPGCSSLRHKLVLQEETMAQDGQGGYIRGWQDVASLWAEIIPLAAGSPSTRRGGRETLVADQLQATISHRILLRYRAGIHPGMRLLFDDRAFNIHHVINQGERNETLEVLAEEGGAS